MADPKEALLIQDIVLLWLLRHGREWPDWNGDLIALSVIDTLAGQLSNRQLGTQLQTVVREHVRVG